MSDANGVYRFRFREQLDRFHLEVELECEVPFLGVFGVSGSGKTTLLECIAGLRSAVEGEISFKGQQWLDSREGRYVPVANRGIGYVPQDHLLFPHLTVRENLLFGQARMEEGNGDGDSAFEEVVSALELEVLLERSVTDLSGGEKQRVALGRALCSGPQLLLLDEPMASLDSALRRRALSYLVRIRERFSIPMIVVSHNPVELQALCDEALVLESGSIVGDGSPQEVFTQPKIFAAAKRSGFENVLAGRVVVAESESDSLQFELDGGSCRIHIPETDSKVESAILISIASDDILVGIEEPKGLSARNRIRATIERIEQVDSRFLIHAQIDNAIAEVAVEITGESIAELELAPGKTVYLVFKTSSVSVLRAD